jgi:hypothetical protein
VFDSAAATVKPRLGHGRGVWAPPGNGGDPLMCDSRRGAVGLLAS